jgi:hypothetical protein
MRRRSVQRLGWWLLVLLAVGGCAISLLGRQRYTADDVVEPVTVLVYAVVGAVVTRRRPENPIGWVFLLIAALLAMVGTADTVLQRALEDGPPAPWWGVASAWIYSWSWLPLLMLATTFTFLLYPSGPASRRWRWVVRLSVGATVGASALIALYPTLDIGVPDEDPSAWSVANPLSPPIIGDAIAASEAWAAPAGALLLMFCGLAGVWSVVLRTWRSTGVERLQMRLFAFVILLVPLHIMLGGLVSGWVDSVLGDFTFGLIMLLIPVSCGVAILRYHLYDIDRIIGRTTAYLLVTAALVGVYLAVVYAVSIPLPRSNALQVAAATLAAAAVFRPVLGWAQRLVNRRFNRDQFDASQAVEEFAARLLREVDPSEVSDDLLDVLHRTVQPARSGLWLAGGGRP